MPAASLPRFLDGVLYLSPGQPSPGEEHEIVECATCASGPPHCSCGSPPLEHTRPPRDFSAYNNARQGQQPFPTTNGGTVPINQTAIPGSQRYCPTCGETRDASEFYTWTNSRCRPCQREYRRVARQNAGANTRGPAGARVTHRVFGVELELTGPDAGTIIRALTAAGISLHPRNVSTERELPYGHTVACSTWSLKGDGSVHGESLELVSPKLRGPSGFAALETVCRVLNDIGASVDSSCGLHAHHDFRRLPVESVRRQVLAFVERQDLIWSLVAPSRLTNGYCPAWTTVHTSSLRNATSLSSIGVTGPRGNLNMWSYGIRGSVEIRCHAGTTNYKKVAAWVRFGQSLFAAAEAGATLSTTSVETLLTELAPFGLTATDASWLLRFRTVGQTRAEVEESIDALRASIESAEAVLEEVS